MTLLHRLALPVIVVSLVGCQQQPADPIAQSSAVSAGPAAAPTPAPAAAQPAPSPSEPTATPTRGASISEAEKGETGARSLLLDWARAIELRKFAEARALLSPADQAKWSAAAWRQMFADLGKITVAVPTGSIEGAAGSLYYEAPVTITAHDAQGRPVRYEGTAVLRRVNDVDGATPAQLRWHFEKLSLDWTH